MGMTVFLNRDNRCIGTVDHSCFNLLVSFCLLMFDLRHSEENVSVIDLKDIASQRYVVSLGLMADFNRAYLFLCTATGD